MKEFSVLDPEFRKYGEIIEGYDFSELVKTMEEKTPLPEGVEYVASLEVLEQLPIARQIEDSFYGELPIEVGYCNGHTEALEALEYHRSSEINVAATDMRLALGLLTDVKDDYTYDPSKVEVFTVPKGMAVHIYATTLHYAPWSVEGKGFKCCVILPKGTNADLDKKMNLTREDALLVAKNKWLINL